MSIHLTRGDITQTRAQAMLVGLNTRGKTEVSPLEARLRDVAPVFFSDYRRRARAGHLTLGDIWIFRESTPWYVGAVLRGVPGGATRTRHLEKALRYLRQHHRNELLRSLAIAPLGTPEEADLLQQVLVDELQSVNIPVIIYEAYIPGQAPAEPATLA